MLYKDQFIDNNMMNIVFQASISWSDLYNYVVVTEWQKLDIAIQKTSWELWIGFGGFDDLDYPLRERTVESMSEIAQIFAQKIEDHSDILPYIAGKLLKESVNSVRIDDYKL